MIFRFILACAWIGWLASGSAVVRADESSNPYRPIVVRNMFGLVPIPTNNPAADLPPPTPPPKITPNGIMTLFGKVQVLFKVAGVPKAGQPAKDESYVLGVGERQDEIEVEKIDEPSATITFNNHGTIQELSLVAGTASGGGASAPAALPSGFGLPAPTPSTMPGGGGMSAPIGGGGRFGRSRNPGSGFANPAAPAGSSLGQFGNSTQNNSASANHFVDTEGLSPEAQVIMIEANRAATQEQVNQGLLPPLPPTPLTPADATAHGGSPLIAPNN
jgi:hypothetical protein